MSNPTSNFNWQMPTNTDLVSQLPADFEVFGQAVDTSLADLRGGTTGQVLKKNTNTDMDFVWAADDAGFTNPMTTTGDIIYSSSGSTAARLGIGTTGQVLNVAAGVPAWTTPSTPTTSYTLINAGGTALTGATSVTVSGISGKNKLMIYIEGASSANAGATIQYRFNGDGSSIYGQYFYRITGDSTYNDDIFTSFNAITQSELILAKMAGTAGSQVNGYVNVDGAASTTRKIITAIGGGNEAGNTGQTLVSSGAYYDGTSAISSFTLISNSGNFDAGTLFIYGA